MIYRSKAPLRIGLAGGGTDVSPYSDLYGGLVLNTTISLYAHVTLQPVDGNDIIIEALDRKEKAVFPCGHDLPIDGTLDLHKGVYNCIRKDYGGPTGGFRLSTYVDVPAGSGLGSSSTLVVAMIGAFKEMLRLPLRNCDIAQYAYTIEREYLRFPGGRQDQYAATYGGVNLMEFSAENKVVVEPLHLKKEHLLELENNLLLFFTSTSRKSDTIIREQTQNVAEQHKEPVEAMHQLRQQVLMMKEAMLSGHLAEIGPILDYGYQQKLKTASGISNPAMDEIYSAAKKAGASGGKISGAGGGGFMVFYCPGTTKYAVMETLQKFGGFHPPYHFVERGLTTWSV